jgi:hypothetical protein
MIDNAHFREMVRDRENLSSVLNSAPQKSTNMATIFKNVFKNCKNAGLCNQTGLFKGNFFTSKTYTFIKK